MRSAFLRFPPCFSKVAWPTVGVMLRLFVPRETDPNETRAALDPASVKKLAGEMEIHVETGAGAKADFPNKAYQDAGATIASDASGIGECDIVLRVRRPAADDIAKLKAGALHVSFLDPFNHRELLDTFAERQVNAVSLEMIPRTTLAQKMDALSSQSNLAGYAAVMIAGDRSRQVLPMMMTPAGTISPARFFIIGVGVAGLQAIATAKRLGARVEAFDTRPEVEEQVKSLAAKFVKVDLGDTGSTEQGYAQQLTDEQMQKQQQAMADACARADIVITTAKVFGRKAPQIITEDILGKMKPGSIVVDLAVEAGGNVAGSKLGEEVETENGVRVIGPANAEGYYPRDATAMLGANFAHFITHFWDEENQAFDYRLDEPILKGCLITHEGKIVHEKFIAEK